MVWRQDLLHIAQRPRRCGGDHDGAGRLHPMAFSKGRRRNCRFPPVSSFSGSLIAIGGIILFAPLLAQWSLAFGRRNISPNMVYCHRLSWQHDGAKPAASFLAALIGAWRDRRRGRQHRGLSR
ncbi:hypothetical protein KCP77_07785 [Salmonella enterica subsp. enterica]|nr:hypothetical protein KCP77_07785 [Salmonella enterica subsp. enterica]